MSVAMAMNMTEGNKSRSERRMRWLGKDVWGLLSTGSWTTPMVSGAGKGMGCCGMSVGHGGEDGMVVDVVSVGD